MSKYKTKDVVMGRVFLIGFAFAGFYILLAVLLHALLFHNGNDAGRVTSEPDHSLREVIDWNTKQIHSLGVNAAIEKQNAELLIQILNVLEGNDVKAVPRNIPISDLLNSDEPIEDDDVPHTHEQVIKDQKEVDRGIRAAANNNLFQNDALHNILDKIKESHLTNQ